jgi:ParB-like chromosome segregation protein Spo0J
MAQHIKHWPIGRIVPSAPNPKKHSDAQIAAIAASLRQYSFTAPILADNHRRRARRGSRREG